MRKTTECLGMERSRKDLQLRDLSQTPLEHTVVFIEEVFIATIVIKQQRHQIELMKNNS